MNCMHMCKKSLDKILTGGFVVLLMSSGLSAQVKADLPQDSFTRDLKSASITNSSWFNPERFSMSHSFGMSLLTADGMSQSIGIYTNQMRLLLSNNLTLDTRLHVLQSSLMNAEQPGQPNMNLLYDAMLHYRISENMHVSFGISNLPPLYYRGYPDFGPAPYSIQNFNQPATPAGRLY